MTKILLTLCFILIGLGQTKAQLRMAKAAAIEAMSTLVFTVETKTTKAGTYEFTHFMNTKLNHEIILRINKEGTCDQLITVMPMDEWDHYVKLFNGENPDISTEFKPSGKNMWKKEDGTISTLLPHEGKNYFSLVLATPDAKN